MSFEFSDHLDDGFLKEIYGEDVNYAYEMFSTFLNIIDGEMEALSRLIYEDDFVEAKKALHKIKPMFSMVGLTDLSKNIEIFKNSIKPNSMQLHRKKLDVFLETLANNKPLLENEKNRLYKRKK